MTPYDLAIRFRKYGPLVCKQARFASFVCAFNGCDAAISSTTFCGIGSSRTVCLIVEGQARIDVPPAMTQVARASGQNAGAPGKRLFISTAQARVYHPGGHRCYLLGSSHKRVGKGPSTLQHNAASSGQNLEAVASLGSAFRTLCVSLAQTADCGVCPGVTRNARLTRQSALNGHATCCAGIVAMCQEAGPPPHGPATDGLLPNM